MAYDNQPVAITQWSGHVSVKTAKDETFEEVVETGTEVSEDTAENQEVKQAEGDPNFWTPSEEMPKVITRIEIIQLVRALCFWYFYTLLIWFRKCKEYTMFFNIW